MQTVPLAVRSPLTRARVARAVAHCGLQIKTVGTLATYRGCAHWHIGKPGATGTLELTYWPQTGEAWFAIHANRHADWIETTLPALTRLLQSETPSSAGRIPS